MTTTITSRYRAFKEGTIVPEESKLKILEGDKPDFDEIAERYSDCDILVDKIICASCEITRQCTGNPEYKHFLCKNREHCMKK